MAFVLLGFLCQFSWCWSGDQSVLTFVVSFVRKFWVCSIGLIGAFKVHGVGPLVAYRRCDFSHFASSGIPGQLPLVSFPGYLLRLVTLTNPLVQMAAPLWFWGPMWCLVVVLPPVLHWLGGLDFYEFLTVVAVVQLMLLHLFVMLFCFVFLWMNYFCAVSFELVVGLTGIHKVPGGVWRMVLPCWKLMVHSLHWHVVW